MKAVAQANGGLAPLAAAWDCGGANQLINAMYLGLLPTSVVRSLPFFSDATMEKIDIPCFTFRALFAKGGFMSGCNDPNHVMKRYSHHLVTGCRHIRMGSYLVNLTPMIRQGLSLRALGCDDIQSDVDMARRMCSSYTPEAWDSFGIIIAQYINGLITSGWTACKSFTLREGCANVMTAYYLLLIMVKEAQGGGRGQFKEKFLPVQTTRNLLDLCGHLILAARHWPGSAPWLPVSRAEACIERWFGNVKGFTRGASTVKDAVYGQAHVHASQLRESDALMDLAAPCEVPLTDGELQALANQALDDACDFQVWLMGDWHIGFCFIRFCFGRVASYDIMLQYVHDVTCCHNMNWFPFLTLILDQKQHGSHQVSPLLARYVAGLDHHFSDSEAGA